MGVLVRAVCDVAERVVLRLGPGWLRYVSGVGERVVRGTGDVERGFHAQRRAVVGAELCPGLFIYVGGEV